MILKMIAIGLLMGAILSYTFKKAVEGHNQTATDQEKITKARVIEWLKIAFIKAPLGLLLIVLGLLVISLPFIFAGPVGGAIIWTCVLIVLRLW